MKYKEKVNYHLGTIDNLIRRLDSKSNFKELSIKDLKQELNLIKTHLAKVDNYISLED